MSTATWHAAVMAEAVTVLGQHTASSRRAADAQSMVLEHLAEVAYDAAHDPMTGLANRSQVHAMLDVLTESERRGAIAVLYVDLDEFKPVNDRLGHYTGDAVLTQVAQRLVAAAGPCDVVGRVGGDEFVVVYHCVDPVLTGSMARNRIASRLAAPMRVDDVVVRVSASVGLSVARGGEVASTEDLLRSADADMFRHKRSNWVISA